MRYLIFIKQVLITVIDVEGAFNLLLVIILGSAQGQLSTAVQALVETLTKTESNKTGLKQKM